MKDIRVYLPVFLLIIIVLLLAGCGGITPTPPSPGTTDDVTTISGQILMPTICCLPLPDEDQANTARNGCDETEFWAEVPDARVVLRSAQKCKNDLDETFADSSGYYEFEDVKPGLYIITAYCTEDEGFLVKDVALKVEGEALDAGIPDCTSTGIALVMEKINGCYNDWYQCFNKYTAIYKKVDLIAGLIGNVNIPNIISQAQNIESIEDLATAAGITDLQTILGHFGDVCDPDLYGLVDMICEWSCCIGVGATGGGGGGPTPDPCADNNPPYNIQLDNKIAVVGQLYTGTVTAEDDDDDDTLTFAFTDGYTPPGDMAIDSVTGVITWTPTVDDICFCEQTSLVLRQRGIKICDPIQVTVSDPCESVDAEFCVEVGCSPLNGLVIGIDEATVCDDECATVGPVTVSFGDGTDNLVINDLEDTCLVWDTTPSGITFNKSDGKVCLTSCPGTYTLGVTYTDACYVTVHGEVGITFELCCPELSTLELCVTIPDTLCQDDCATVNSATVIFGDATTMDVALGDLTWNYDPSELTFDSVTNRICLAACAVPGTYLISATYEDECEETVTSADVSLTFEACCDELIVDAGPDQCIQLDCGPQVEVFFDGSGSSGTDLTYEWDFDNDGFYDETGQSPSYMFSAGTYTVTLTVTDSCGNSESDTMELNVLPACDLPDQLTVSEISTSPSNYYLKVKFSDGSGDVLSGSWYYGWCAHSDLIGIPAVGQQLYVYCTLDSSLELADYWPKINWIINNRAGYTKSVVQDAVWHYINGKSVSGSAATLVGLANSHPDFCPAIGDKFVVLLTQNPMDSYGIYSKSNEQPILIEVIRENHCEIPS